MNAPPGAARDVVDTTLAPRPPLAIGVIGSLVAIKLLLHVVANVAGPYEFHRDEFLYMAMGDHLRLFRMDFPPLIALVSEAVRGVFGDSRLALRLVPALVSAALVPLAALTARELGGGRFAQGLAGLCVVASPLFLGSGNLFQPVVLDQLWWTLGLFALVKLARAEDPRWWMAFGVGCGLGVLSKFSILLFGFAVFAALVATPARRHLGTPWPWLAALLAFAIGSPSIVGQIRLDWPVFDQMIDLAGAQLARVTPLDFLVEQVFMGPGVLVAGIGLSVLGLGRDWRRYRLVGWSCLLVLVLLIVLKGKPYYAGPIYPALFGAGAVVLERLTMSRSAAVARWAAVGLVTAYGLVSAPVALPLLPPAVLESYLVTIGIQEAVAVTNVGDRERIPQDFADMLHWEPLVAEVARVYRELPPADRERAVILASNYGEAGAIDFYGPRYRLPPARAFVGTYWFFGPGPLPGEVLLLVGYEDDDFAPFCATREAAGHVTHPFTVTEQRDLVVYVCREPIRPLQAQWPRWEGEQ